MFALMMILLNLPFPKVHIGMTPDEFKKIYPNSAESVYEDQITCEIKDRILKTPVEWGFRFRENRLDWIYMSHYSDELTDKNFKICLKMAEKLISETEKIYGKADEIKIGEKNFADPYTDKHHWGYDVIEARWKSVSGMKIKIYFTFMGSKGIYKFLVKMNVFDENYPYYD